jgi:hypothetical protein
MEHSSIIDYYLSLPYWVIDILPKQVPSNGHGQYFKIEGHFLSEPQFGVICKKFSNIIIKLNCYYDISVCTTLDDWSDNPQPAYVEECLASGNIVYVALKSGNAMIGFCGDDHYMTLYNPDENLLELVSSLAHAEGLFVWKPVQKEKEYEKVQRRNA